MFGLELRAMARALVLALLVAASGCDRPDPGFDGIGPWHIGKTTMKDAVRCDADKDEPDLHWCYLNSDLRIAEQQATIDLYFRGQGDGAPLVEILAGVSRCDEEALDRGLSSKLGPAPERHGSTFVWRQKTATIVARIPSERGECEIVFLAPSETARLGKLIARGTPAPTP
jgi:hypothetical protein